MFDVKVYNDSQIKLVRSLGTQGVEMLKSKAFEIGEGLESSDFKYFKDTIVRYMTSCTEFIESCSEEGRTVDHLAIAYMQRKFEFLKKQVAGHYRSKKQQIAASSPVSLRLTYYWQDLNDRIRAMWTPAYKSESSPALFI